MNAGRVYDLLGHTLGRLSFARPIRERGVSHYVSDRGLARLVLTRRGYGAITFGHVVVSTHPLDERGWLHELEHVAQYDRYGIRFVPLYLWYQLRFGYSRNPLEQAAELVARASTLDSTT